MIGYLNGILADINNGSVVIDVNGFGMNVTMPNSFIESLPEINHEVKVYTYTSVREDGISLYGFLDKESLDIFNLLISVSGVGPKGAQALISTFSVSMIKYYIVTEDVNKLSKAPTIGKKTAERIIVDLKDKVNKEDILNLKEEKTVNGLSLSSEAEDAILALEALGYDKKSAKEAVSKIENIEELDSNQILKLSLQYMF